MRSAIDAVASSNDSDDSDYNSGGKKEDEEEEDDDYDYGSDDDDEGTKKTAKGKTGKSLTKEEEKKKAKKLNKALNAKMGLEESSEISCLDSEKYSVNEVNSVSTLQNANYMCYSLARRDRSHRVIKHTPKVRPTMLSGAWNLKETSPFKSNLILNQNRRQNNKFLHPNHRFQIPKQNFQ